MLWVDQMVERGGELWPGSLILFLPYTSQVTWVLLAPLWASVLEKEEVGLANLWGPFLGSLTGPSR